MWLMLVVHAWLVVANVAALSFTVGAAIFYRFSITDVGIQIGVSQIGTNTTDFFVPVIAALSLISAIHLLMILSSVSLSRRLIAGAIHACTRRLRMTRAGASIATVLPAAHEGSLAASKTRTTGFSSRYSAEITRLMILWEIALQTFQAYKISYLVASVSINRLIALVIVTNCWFSPLLHYTMGNRPAAHVRLGRLLLDTSLDLIYNVGIPLTIFYPYYRDFNGSTQLYPVVFYYDDTWYVNALSELRQVFVTSWLDYVSKTSGSALLVYHLWKVQTAVDDVNFKVANLGSCIDSTWADGPPDSSFARRRKWYRSRLSRVLDLVLLLSGATILSLHLTASITSLRFHDPDCLLEMRPWGTLSYSCASFEISCSKRRTSGDRETMNSILTTVDPMTVVNLVLSNCPQLQVPTAIQSLQLLTMIKIYNSTIASWDAQAALHQVNHPQLQVIFLVRVNGSGIPEGLLADDLPRSLWDIEFYITNISTFPAVITKAWTNVGLVVFDMNPKLSEFPQVLTTLPNLFTLVLGMTNITTIPDGTYYNQALVSLGMHSSPIERLPDSVGSIDHLEIMNFENTKIAMIPSSWMDIEVPVWGHSRSAVMYAGGTPLCDSHEAHGVMKPTWLKITCEKLSRDEYSYPIEQEDAWRSRNQ
jgi:hypothetical protein